MHRLHWKRRQLAQALFFVLLPLLLSACAPPQPEQGARFFWPPPWVGSEPKIEFIDVYRTDYEIEKGSEHWLSEAVLGRERPKKLFSRPTQVVGDNAKRVFVSDVDYKKVLVLDFEGRQVRALTNRRGTHWTFGFPGGLALDGEGGVYVVDTFGKQVIHFDAEEKYLDEFGGDQLNRPTGLAVDPSRRRVYVVDTGAHRIAVFDVAGNFIRHIGERGGKPGQFNFPVDADVGPQGNLYVLDSLNARVQVFDPEGSFLRSFGERGDQAGFLQLPKGIAVSPAGHVYVTDSKATRFTIFDAEGAHLLTVGGRFVATGRGVEPGGFYLVQGIDVDESHAIWIVDSLNRMIHRFQFLDEAYLERHPILPGQAYSPPGM